MFTAPDIPGAIGVIEWFGHWPTFHDAKVLSITLVRSGESRVVIHAFEITSEIDSTGHYVLAKHSRVTFCMEGFPLDRCGITKTRVDCFNHQNVLSSAAVKKTPEGYELMLEASFGVEGSISCERMSVKIEPWNPAR
jgi:hypothetical protein